MAKVLIPVNPNSGLDLNQDGKVTVDELVRSALLIFIALNVLLGALIVGGWLLVTGKFPPWRIMGIIPLLAAILTATLLLWRMTRYERQEREDRRELEFKREKERWEFDQARGISQEAGATTMTQAQIDMAAEQIIARYYTGKEWSREACEKDGVMGSELWNEANKLLRERGIRRGRSRDLEPETYAKAWGIYCKAKLEANRHKMGSANDDWREAG